ncbi:TRAP transporter large permease [Verminephrobacter aporrectodeae]|uniref:TRAP transporter large permease protein n=1 Tax=Verminephrobacter aporrectodeae subsp. tuberculatae TaxID=1110392 RepID=A0ABT3KZ26_9BURK|nr:TRAP transporter large permease [Verminephrobacter aporrectodeae]MCW5222196.1 TRAP transporter large permease [Verminephrobacter aporrectodeae subsp. tuberculatae]MCW5257605.1 TRAP transporter large permease [Verminephrobacter aporrectodeae subsp. tuberculatae]MCW5287660.1 TRAP transporter large permease [Verminephrobacter aporrectodeae subsp. tuberculatae]MCW5323595.1 TRAP transporter large permease [Verminephrobacter aporrectodeae subsp. tuberculatae]MCW8164881.1 TRAP transporter large pe
MSGGALFLMGVFMLTMLVDLPIVYGMVLSGLAYLAIFDTAPVAVAAQQYVSGLDSFTLLAIPLFILAAQLMNGAGLTQRIVRLCAAIVGDVKGGLAVVAVMSCLVFGALSGSGVADVLAIGSLLLPAMARAGYDKGFSCALVGCAGTSATIVPPSIVLIIYGTTTNTSVGKLFMAGIVPAVLLSLSLIAIAVWQARKYDWSGGKPFEWAELRASLSDAVPALMVPVLIIGGIRLGVFTASEAASSAIAYSLLIGLFWYRTLSLRTIWQSLKVAGEGSASILLMIGASGFFAWILVAEQVPQALAALLASWTDSRTTVLLLLTAVLLLLGTFMEAIPIIIIVAPVVMPVLAHYRIDPVHFGILLTINMAIGAVSPPVGVDLMAACKVGGITMMQTLRPLTWMMLAMVGVLMLVTFVPDLVMFLPRHVQ